MNSSLYEEENKNNKILILDRCIKGLNFIGEYEKAEIYSKELIKIDPTLSDLHRLLIGIYVFKGEYEKAIAECNYELNHT